MLVQPEYKEGEIYVFKLTTGEEIITKVKSITDKKLVIQDPLAVTIVRGNDGKPGKILMPASMLITEGTFKLHIDKILLEIEAPKEIADVWVSETSGLILATGNMK
jgi:hypothetical protein